MMETSIKDNLNCKMQANARVCKSKLNEENGIYEKMCKFEGSYRNCGGGIKMIFSRMIHHSIKVLALY